jgi:hypothetical protein
LTDFSDKTMRKDFDRFAGRRDDRVGRRFICCDRAT